MPDPNEEDEGRPMILRRGEGCEYHVSAKKKPRGLEFLEDVGDEHQEVAVWEPSGTLPLTDMSIAGLTSLALIKHLVMARQVLTHSRMQLQKPALSAGDQETKPVMEMMQAQVDDLTNWVTKLRQTVDDLIDGRDKTVESFMEARLQTLSRKVAQQGDAQAEQLINYAKLFDAALNLEHDEVAIHRRLLISLIDLKQPETADSVQLDIDADLFDALSSYAQTVYRLQVAKELHPQVNVGKRLEQDSSEYQAQLEAKELLSAQGRLIGPTHDPPQQRDPQWRQEALNTALSVLENTARYLLSSEVPSRPKLSKIIHDLASFEWHGRRLKYRLDRHLSKGVSGLVDPNDLYSAATLATRLEEVMSILNSYSACLKKMSDACDAAANRSYTDKPEQHSNKQGDNSHEASNDPTLLARYESYLKWYSPHLEEWLDPARDYAASIYARFEPFSRKDHSDRGPQATISLLEKESQRVKTSQAETLDLLHPSLVDNQRIDSFINQYETWSLDHTAHHRVHGALQTKKIDWPHDIEQFKAALESVDGQSDSGSVSRAVDTDENSDGEMS
jgi:hypothetical protein